MALRQRQKQANSAETRDLMQDGGSETTQRASQEPGDDPWRGLAILQTLALFHLNTLLHVPDIGYSSSSMQI